MFKLISNRTVTFHNSPEFQILDWGKLGFLPTAKEDNVFIGVCLSTGGSQGAPLKGDSPLEGDSLWKKHETRQEVTSYTLFWK